MRLAEDRMEQISSIGFIIHYCQRMKRITFISLYGLAGIGIFAGPKGEKINMQSITELMDDLYAYVDREIHTLASPNNWYLYSELRDKLDDLQ